MKVATWNVNSIKARLDHAKAWLEKNKPDVLMVQEIKGEVFPVDEFAAIGYNTAYKGQKAYNGIATLSPHTIEVLSDRLAGNDADEQARYLETRIKGIRFINIYLPNGNPVDSEKYPYKLDWMNRLKNRVVELREVNDSFLIAGDFNAIPQDEDCYDPKIWVQDALYKPETRLAFRAIVNLGLTDAYRVFHKGPKHYTYWDYQAGAWSANRGIRIDHILLSPPLADRLVASQIDKEPRGWDKASDHTPILAILAD